MSGFAPGGSAWLIAICVSRVGSYMVYIAYAATLPVLQREWHLSGTAAGSIASAFQVAYALSLMGCSTLADRVGARRVFLVGTVTSAVVAAAFATYARDYWSGLWLYTLLGLAQGSTYTTGILLVAENVPVERRGRAMGAYLAGHSLGLALALMLAGVAIPRGGYVLAFWLLALGAIVGGVVAWIAVRSTANVVTSRAAGQRFVGEVLRNRPAMLLIAGYTFHSWELLGMWAWTPAFLSAALSLQGQDLETAAGGGAAVGSLFHLTGFLASVSAGYLSDRFGRTAVIIGMLAVSTACSLAFGWLVAAPFWLLLLVGLVYGFSSVGDSPVLSVGITEVVAPQVLGSVLAARSLLGFGAGALAQSAFGVVLDLTNPTRPYTQWGWAYGLLGLGGLGGLACAVWLRLHPQSLRLASGRR